MDGMKFSAAWPIFLWQFNEVTATSVLISSLFLELFFACSKTPPSWILPKRFLTFPSQAQLPFVYLHASMAAHPRFQCLKGGQNRSSSCWLPPKKTWGKCQGLFPLALQGWILHRRDFRKHWLCSECGTVLWQPEFHQSQCLWKMSHWNVPFYVPLKCLWTPSLPVSQRMFWRAEMLQHIRRYGASEPSILSWRAALGGVWLIEPGCDQTEWEL